MVLPLHLTMMGFVDAACKGAICWLQLLTSAAHPASVRQAGAHGLVGGGVVGFVGVYRGGL